MEDLEGARKQRIVEKVKDPIFRVISVLFEKQRSETSGPFLGRTIFPLSMLRWALGKYMDRDVNANAMEIFIDKYTDSEEVFRLTGEFKAVYYLREQFEMAVSPYIEKGVLGKPEEFKVIRLPEDAGASYYKLRKDEPRVVIGSGDFPEFSFETGIEELSLGVVTAIPLENNTMAIPVPEITKRGPDGGIESYFLHFLICAPEQHRKIAEACAEGAYENISILKENFDSYEPIRNFLLAVQELMAG